MQALVIVGGSRSQRSLLVEAQSRGLRTCVVDGSAQAPLLAGADVAVVHDFSDTVGAIEAVRAAGVEPLGVVTMGSDAAVVPAAVIAAEFELPGLSPTAALRCSDKRLMRDAFAGHDVALRFATGHAVADVEALAAAFDEHGPSIVVKPVDGAGQRGVTHVASRERLAWAFAAAMRHSRRGAVLFETFLHGDEFTVSGFSVEGEYHPVLVSRRELFPEPPLGVCRAHRYPSGLDADAHAAAVDAAREATRAVGIEHGPSYVQLRMVDGEPWLIEVGARLGGGKDAELARLVVGIDQVPAVLDAALGALRADALAPRGTTNACGAVRFVAREPGLVTHLDAGAAQAMPHVHEAGFYYPVGSYYPPLVDGAGRIGYCIVTADTPHELDDRLRAAEASLEIGIEPVAEAAAVTT